jgi:hypothetical protein
MSERGDEEPRRPPPEEDADQPSVMGSLPRSRPSIRSPRRDEAKVRMRSGGRGGSASAGGGPAAGAGLGRAAAGPPPAPDAGGPVLEELARAGLSAGVGAAAFGLRLAGRAASAVRESLERR